LRVEDFMILRKNVRILSCCFCETLFGSSSWLLLCWSDWNTQSCE